MFTLRVDAELDLVLAEERHAADVTRLVARNHERLARWEPWAALPNTVEGSRAYIRSWLEGFAAGRHVHTLLRVDGALVGSCGLRLDVDSGNGDIGYWVDASLEGRGLVTRAARALVGTAFAERRLVRVELRTAVGNARSRAVAERLGFHYEGTMRQAQQFPDRREDLALYSALAADWPH